MVFRASSGVGFTQDVTNTVWPCSVSQRHVQDIELVDPGRKEEDRRLSHGLGQRRILDELEQFVAEDDLALRGGDVFAELEGAHVRLPQGEVTAPALQIFLEHLQAAQQVLAAGFDRFLQDRGIREDEVGRRERVRRLLQEERCFAALCRIDIRRARRKILQPFALEGVGAPQQIEQGVLTPVRITEAPVARERVMSVMVRSGEQDAIGFRP
jgi:hypothetical protein